MGKRQTAWKGDHAILEENRTPIRPTMENLNCDKAPNKTGSYYFLRILEIVILYWKARVTVQCPGVVSKKRPGGARLY